MLPNPEVQRIARGSGAQQKGWHEGVFNVQLLVHALQPILNQSKQKAKRDVFFVMLIFATGGPMKA